MSVQVHRSPSIPEPELVRCVDTLTRAFEDYPLMAHFIDPENRTQRLRRFQEIFLRDVGMTAGHVWSADGGRAVSIWTSPAMADPAAVFGPLQGELMELAGSRAEVMAAAEEEMGRHRPTEPCWFLGSVGVDPEHQGRGLARAVLEPGLERASREGLPAFLETSSSANVDLYRRFGFEVTATYELPGGGPETYAMLRAA
ncbi:GNAT family N-acetyltransferase [Kytococcus sp. Marseille-QA3725]